MNINEKSENKIESKAEGPKNFPAAPFLILFFTAGSWEKGIKNDAARKIIGPSYFVTALNGFDWLKWSSLTPKDVRNFKINVRNVQILLY